MMIPNSITVLYFLRCIGQYTSNEGKCINAEIKPAVNFSCLFSSQAVLCLKEKHQYCHHGVESKPFSHIGKKGDY